MAILMAAQQARNAARWAIALALGLRQGETLGLQWSDVDLDQAEQQRGFQTRARALVPGRLQELDAAQVLGLALAQALTLLTEENPPFNYVENGKLTGLVTGLVVDAMQRANVP